MGGNHAESKPGKVRKLSVISRLHANVVRVDNTQGTWVFGLLWFASDVGIEVIRNLVKEKLLTIPRFRSKLVLKRGVERFVELPLESIDLEHHVKLVTEPWTEKQLIQDYISEVYKQYTLDYSRPLWQFTYFTDVEGRTLLLTNINHALGDGVSTVEVLFRLLDDKPTPTAEKEGLSPAESEPTAQIVDSKASEPSANVGEALRPPARRTKKKGSFGPLNRARIFLTGAISPFLFAFGSPDTPSPLMRKELLSPSTVKSTAFTAKLPLQQVKEVKNKFPGATVNDVLVALLTMMFRAYLVEKLETGDAKQRAAIKKLLRGEGKIRTSFPINARKPGKDSFRDGSPHNKIALGELQFDFGFKSRTKLVWTTKRKLDRIKLSPAPFVQQKMANTLIRILPKKAAVNLFQKVGTQTTAMLSNVAGPQTPVYLAGHKVEDLTFALYGGSGAYCGLLSYAGQCSAVVCLDESLGDAEVIAKHWKSEFDKLYSEVMEYDGPVPKPFGCFSQALEKL